MIKVLERVDLERMFLSTINGIHEKCTVSIFLNEEKRGTVASKSRIRGLPSLPTPVQQSTQSTSWSNKAKGRN